MITSWNLYWIFRMDSISRISEVASIISTFFAIIMTVGIIIANADNDSDSATIKALGLAAKTLIPISAISILIFILTPKTKEMAAILVIPQIANSDAVQKELPAEARELYGLAKEWLKNQAGNKQVEKE